MNPAASLLLLAALVAIPTIWVVYEIRHAAPEPCCWPTTTDALALKWAEIAEDFAPDEFELLRRADRMMAGVEAAVIRDWQDKPYDHEERGL